MELNHTLHQYHLAALAPFLAMNAQVAAVSPRGNHEEELALQALHAMKNVAPSSIHGLHMGGGRSAQISSGRSVEGACKGLRDTHQTVPTCIIPETETCVPRCVVPDAHPCASRDPLP